MNLLKETIDALGYQGKSPSEVLWVGIKNFPIIRQHPELGWDERIKEISWSWGDFSKIADFEYDDGFGGVEINEGLVIVGKDWWLERHEYDGKEWWEFKTLPKRPTAGKLLTLDMIYNPSCTWGAPE